MTSFAKLPTQERELILHDVAARLNVSAVILEKDFWVTWLLGRLFSTPDIGDHVVFKGGTSLSKVYAAIARFSEDIDLSVMPGLLGFEDADLNEAPSASQRRKRMDAMARACETCVRDGFQPRLESSIAAALGVAPTGWLRYEIDAVAGTPNLLFAYPTALAAPGGYVAKQVKLEFGSLTNQRPVGAHTIRAMLADTPGVDLARFYDDLHASVVALSVERTFWEKATILHAEHHRPLDMPIRDRFARHYADFAALWRHPARVAAMARHDLMRDVVLHKSRFFSSSWARYDTAMPGSFRLVPPVERLAPLSQDYDRMEPMFLNRRTSFESLMDELAEAEQAINAS